MTNTNLFQRGLFNHQPGFVEFFLTLDTTLDVDFADPKCFTEVELLLNCCLLVATLLHNCLAVLQRGFHVSQVVSDLGIPGRVWAAYGVHDQIKAD